MPDQTSHDATVSSGPFEDINAIQRANRALGHHWFSAGAMSFFNSRVVGTVHAGRFFISSERMDFEDPERFTIRMARDAGSIEDVGDFRQFSSVPAAVGTLAAAMREGVHVLPTVREPQADHYHYRVFIGDLAVSVPNTLANCEQLAAELTS